MNNVQIFKGEKPELWLKTTVQVRQDDGRTMSVPIRVKFRKPTQDERQEKQRQIDERGGIDLGDSIQNDLVFWRDWMVDWDIPGNDGSKVEFCDENMEAAVHSIDYRDAINELFMQLFMSPGEYQRLKNWKSSATSGAGRK